MPETLVMRGIARQEVVNCLMNLGGQAQGETIFVGKGWKAVVEPERISRLGVIELSEVEIRFEGQEESLNQLLPVFRLKTLRGGA